jgi:hypothetical protein
MFDPSADFAEVVDGAEAVTLLRRGSDPGGAGTPVAHALRSAAITSEVAFYSHSDVRKQMAAGGHCTSADVVWHLPVVELPLAPQLGDTILDGDDQRWTILDVKRAVRGTRWRCAARNLVVAHGLDDTISVLKAAYVKGSCGAAEAVWQTWKTGVRARIQPEELAIQTDAQSRRTVQQYRIILADDLAIDQSHLILGPDGTTYRVVSSLGAERIGEMQIIEAEVMR